MSRRAFGTVRKLPSGRYQARYRGPDGQRYTAPTVFIAKADADVYLATVHADVVRKAWKAPVTTSETLAAYGARWIEQRHGIKNSTRQQHNSDFRLHVAPTIGQQQIHLIEPPHVRDWLHSLKETLAAKVSASQRRTPSSPPGSATAARSYRVLRAILQTAEDDGLVSRNPCRIRGAGVTRSAERPTLSIDEVATLADRVPAHYRCFVLMAAWTGMRAGELSALRRSNLNFGEFPSVRVVERLYMLQDGTLDFDEPKSAAGKRQISLPGFLAAELEQHLGSFVGKNPDSFVFSTSGGLPLNRRSYGLVLRPALDAIGRPDVRVHDLRHTGQTLAAESGATMAELKIRMGHATTGAAALYMHATKDHGRVIAERLDRLALGARANTEQLRGVGGSTI